MFHFPIIFKDFQDEALRYLLEGILSKTAEEKIVSFVLH